MTAGPQVDMTAGPQVDMTAGPKVGTVPFCPAAPPSGRGWLARRAVGLLSDADARNGLLSVVDQAAVSGASFATSVLVGRLCEPESLGVYYLGLTVVFFIMGIQAELISVPYTIYRQRRRGQDLAIFTGSSLLHQVALSLATVLCLVGAALLLPFTTAPAALGPALWVLCGVVPFLLLRDFLRRLAFAQLKIGQACLLDVTVAVLQVAALLWLGSTGRLSATTVYAVMAASCAGPCLAWFALRQQPLQFSRARAVADWWHNWFFARWALATQLIGSSTPLLLPWLVLALRDEAVTGVLAASDTLCGLGYAFVTAVCNYLTPRAAAAFAAGGVEDLRRILAKTGLLFIATLGPFCLVAFLWGGWLLHLVYGSEYAHSGLVLATLSAAALATSLGMTAGNGLWAMEQPQANFAADAGTLAVTVVAAFCLVEPLGALGAALATLLGAASGTALRSVRLLRVMAAESCRDLEPEVT